MKKICCYVIILVMLTFIIPAFFTSITVENSVLAEKFNSVDNDNVSYRIDYNYKNYSNIKLLHTSTNVIEELPIDEYLYGVVSAEMPVDFEVEALKAQAIVARTYTVYKILQNESKHGNADICDSSSCCQAWISKEDRFARWDVDKQEDNWKKILLAVDVTKGKIITYAGNPINAFFHSNSGGVTEAPVNVWGGGGYPYLQSVETSGEDAYSQYSSELEISKEDFVNKLREKYSDFSINFEEENCIQILEYTEGGRIKTIKIGNYNLSGVEVRTVFGLRSANFKIEVLDTIKFSVIGYGHGVGMSQTGADSLAKQGFSCYDIIKHFYSNVEISDL